MILYIEDEPAAVSLTMISEGKGILYRTAYDPKFARYAPGAISTTKTVEYLIDREHVTEIDFGRDAESYKKYWVRHKRFRWGVIAYNCRTTGGLFGLCWHVFWGCVNKMKKEDDVDDQPVTIPKAGKISRIVYRILSRVLVGTLGQNVGVAAVERVASMFPTLVQVYCGTREPVVRAESEFFLASDDLHLHDFQKVVVVGGGSIPVTAMHWASHFGGPIIVLERNRRTTTSCRRLVRKRRLKNIQVLRMDGEAYEDYDNSIVLFSLHVTDRAAIIEKMVATATGKSAVFVRVPNDESLDVDGVSWQTVKEFRQFRVVMAIIKPRH
jgi:hypothetical protein